MSDELSALREEVARLRRDLDHVRMVLDLNPTPRLQIRDEEETTGVYFMDAQGHCRMRLELNAAGPRLEFLGDGEKPLVSIAAPKSAGQIFVADAGGTPCGVMRSTPLGGYIGVLQASGHPGAYMLCEKQGGKIEVLNTFPHTAVSIFADDNGCGIVRAHEASGETMAFLAANADTGLVTVFGHLGEEAVTLAGSEHGGAVIVCDVNGELTTMFPPPAAEGEEE